MSDAAKESRADCGLSQKTHQAVAYETGFIAGANWAREEYFKAMEIALDEQVKQLAAINCSLAEMGAVHLLSKQNDTGLRSLNTKPSAKSAMKPAMNGLSKT